MNFQVFNRHQAKNYQYMPHDKASAIITISDSNKSNIIFHKTKENNIKAILPLKFDDVDFITKTKDEKVISKEDAKSIVKFVNTYKNKVDIFIVNCEAGVSRSAGCCAAIMLALIGDDSEIFNNPVKVPNMTVYRTVLNAFVENGYFSEDDKGLTEEEIEIKENHNIQIWKEYNEV